ncbi:protein OS-9 [Sarotherodon galilaeus]
MAGLHVFVVVLLGVVSCQNWIPGSEVIIHAGHNITLYCDCKFSSGVYIVWYRDCSRKNQPSLSYDLMILNVTDSDEGLYYCGTEQQRLEDKEFIVPRFIYTYGNATTRIIIGSSKHHEPPQNCDLCWMLLVSLCPVFAGFSSLFSSLLVYHLCRKRFNNSKEPEVDQIRPKTRRLTRINEDEDMCYAALEIRQASQRQKKKTQSSDFCTYSAINISKV